MPRPRPLSAFIQDVPETTPKNLFEGVPGVMASEGRVEGFENLRDILLANWKDLASTFGIPLQALLKLVLETDRHALFAMMAEQKLGEAELNKNKRANWLQDYLHGNVESSTPPEMKLAELPSAIGDDDNGSE